MSEELRIALAQMEIGRHWEHNLQLIDAAAAASHERGARVMLAPEGAIARDPADNNFTNAHAQPLDGPFVTGLREISQRHELLVAATVHVPTSEGRCANVFVACQGGDIVLEYRKIHLYDAFAALESERVDAGDEVPALVDIDGWRLGAMTCYDVRFPEMARALAVAGADALLLPAAWVKGPLKEQHWRTLVTARALDNTVYVAACGETSQRNIGLSLVVDPLGVCIAGASEQPQLVIADLSRARLQQARASLPVLRNRRFQDPTLTNRKEPS